MSDLITNTHTLGRPIFRTHVRPHARTHTAEAMRFLRILHSGLTVSISEEQEAEEEQARTGRVHHGICRHMHAVSSVSSVPHCATGRQDQAFTTCRVEWKKNGHVLSSKVKTMFYMHKRHTHGRTHAREHTLKAFHSSLHSYQADSVSVSLWLFEILYRHEDSNQRPPWKTIALEESGKMT